MSQFARRVCLLLTLSVGCGEDEPPDPTSTEKPDAALGAEGPDAGGAVLGRDAGSGASPIGRRDASTSAPETFLATFTIKVGSSGGNPDGTYTTRSGGVSGLVDQGSFVMAARGSTEDTRFQYELVVKGSHEAGRVFTEADLDRLYPKVTSDLYVNGNGAWHCKWTDAESLGSLRGTITSSDFTSFNDSLHATIHAECPSENAAAASDRKTLLLDVVF